MPYIPYLHLHRKHSIPIIVTIHTMHTIHTVISNIPYTTDLHTIPTIHTIPSIHGIHTIPTIHTKHTILSKHAIPNRPNTPHILNIPYHTPTTPQGGERTVPHPHHTTGGGERRCHMGAVYGSMQRRSHRYEHIRPRIYTHIYMCYVSTLPLYYLCAKPRLYVFNIFGTYHTLT